MERIVQNMVDKAEKVNLNAGASYVTRDQADDRTGAQ